MCNQFHASHHCNTEHCGCGGMLTVEEEIQSLEVHRSHLQLQLQLVEKRMNSLKNLGK